jgi:hypothetical protein
MFSVLLVMLRVLIPSQVAPPPTEAKPLDISGVRIILFGPTRAERDSIAQGEGFEIDDVLDEFALASGKVAVYASTLKIPVETTESPQIHVRLKGGRVRPFDRKAFSGVVGMILTDGVQEPRLVPGGGSGRELITAIQEFFHIH